MSFDPRSIKSEVAKLTYTEIPLPDERCEMTLPAGTIVFCREHFALERDTAVVIEVRGATNYDNQRRARYVSDQEYDFRFYVKGRFGLPGRPPIQDQTLDESSKDVGTIVRGEI